MTDRMRFIDAHRAMFWYTPEAQKKDISDELLVETILNDGTLDDYRELRKILTPQRMARVFFSARGRQTSNYHPEIRHFFSLLLKPYYNPPSNETIQSALTKIATEGCDQGGAA